MTWNVIGYFDEWWEGKQATGDYELPDPLKGKWKIFQSGFSFI